MDGWKLDEVDVSRSIGVIVVSFFSLRCVDCFFSERCIWMHNSNSWSGLGRFCECSELKTWLMIEGWERRQEENGIENNRKERSLKRDWWKEGRTNHRVQWDF